MNYILSIIALAAVAFSASVGSKAQQAQTLASPGTPVARFEYRAFASQTLTDQEFLIGKKDNSSISLAAELRFPSGVPANQKLPAIVLLEGSGGLGSSDAAMDSWKADLNKLGIVTVAIDSFTNRGIFNTMADQTQLGRLNMIIDAWRALEFLSKDPRIDVTRVAVMGFSRGGQAALYAAERRFQQLHGPAGLEFAAYVAEYPWCGTAFHDDTNLSDKPIFVATGDQDNYTVGQVKCKEFLARVPQQGRSISFVIYAGAQHYFDSPATPVAVRDNAITNRNCRMGEGENGQILNLETKNLYSEKTDTCVEKGPTAGWNETANAKLRADVTAFLKKALKLN